MIVANGVSKAYGNTLVVDDVTLQVPRGGITSIIGPNGAGKSTFLSIVSRLTRADRGTVTIDGLDVVRTPSRELARRMAILRQDNPMTARLSVRDLVAFGRYPYNQGRPTTDDEARVERALTQLELQPLAGRFLDELSGGQRQRAFVAMVLCQDTDYVLLDEPLNNLDLKHAAAMMKLLERAAIEMDKTVMVVLHDINFASMYSDHIIAMRDGRLLRHGPPEQIITPDVLREIYGMEVQVHFIEGQRVALFYR